MRWLILCLFVVGCGSDPVYSGNPCVGPLDNFYHQGCVVYTEALGQPLSQTEALEECAQWIDVCDGLISCLAEVPSGLDCGGCNKEFFECRNLLTN